MFETAASMSDSILSNNDGNNSLPPNNSFNNNPLILQNSSSHSNCSTITLPESQPLPPKKNQKKRSLPGKPDPDAEVIALSPESLLATNRFKCEVCNKGFQRDQNLQLHRRGHNLPWKLKQRNKDVEVKKKAYVCPEPSCVHHHPSRALCDLTGIKKHFSRKHGEKKFKCQKCSKIYAVQSDWKAHSKICGTREYRCDCGTLFSRKDSFITHRAFCNALAEEGARFSTNPLVKNSTFSRPQPQPQPPLQQPPFPNLATSQNPSSFFHFTPRSSSISLSPSPWDPPSQNPNPDHPIIHIKSETPFSPPPFFQSSPPTFYTTGATSTPILSATALLQKAATVGVMASTTSQTSLPITTGMMSPTMTSEIVMGSSPLASAPPPQPLSTMRSHSQHNHRDHHYDTMVGLPSGFATWQKNEGLTRDFLGLTAGDQYDENGHDDGGGRSTTTTTMGEVSFEGDDEVRDMLKFTSGSSYGEVTTNYDDHNSSRLISNHHLLRHHQQEVEDFGCVTTYQPETLASKIRWC